MEVSDGKVSEAFDDLTMDSASERYAPKLCECKLETCFCRGFE
ncbi:MAG: hypothetical protein QXZ59_01065 [Nitrososphaeria archaeon]